MLYPGERRWVSASADRSSGWSGRCVLAKHQRRRGRMRGLGPATLDDESLDRAVAASATVTGSACSSDLLTRARARLDAGANALVRDPLAQTNDHGPPMSEMKVNFKRDSCTQ